MGQGGLALARPRGSDPAAYLEAEDATSAWLDECCIRDPNAWATSTELFTSWKAWAERSGEFVGSLKRFGQNLEGRGFQPMRKRDGRGFQGIEIDRSCDPNGIGATDD